MNLLNKECYFLDKNEQIEWPELFNKLLEDG